MPAGAQNQLDGQAISGIPQIDDTINPELILYRQQIAPDTVDVYSRGYIPPAMDMSYLEGMAISDGRARAMGPLPSSYMVPVSPVKDQTYFGTCWAFSTYGSLESTLLVGGDTTNDLSEKNLVNRAGFDAIPSLGVENTGGNYFMSTAYLARWDGPVSEADDPYPSGSVWSGSPGTYSTQKHVQNVYFIPGITGSPPNLDNIKNALMAYGAVYTSINTSYTSDVGPFYWNYNPAHYAYYNPRSANLTDHAVTIVGWDDNFLAGNFTPTAPGNGALIVKNSWGTGWGNNGYFYVSYYDAKIGRSNAVFLAEPTTKADHIYQYDMLGLVGYGGYYYSNFTPCEMNWLANVFQANGDEKVSNVSFYAKYPGMQYTVYIYTDPSPGNPSSGTMGASQAGTLTWPGYNTINIANPVAVGAGHKFSVIVKLTNPTTYYHNYNIPLCYADAYSLTSNATGVPDVGYISPDGIAWDEITEGFGEPTITNCLKAFTVDVPTGPSLQFNSESYSVNENNGTVTLVVDKVGTTDDTVYVNYATANGTALAGINYQAPVPNPSTLSIGPSQSSGTITIPILDDSLYSEYETKTFTVSLSSPVNAQLGTITQATVTISEDDMPPALYFESEAYDVNENNGTVYVNVVRQGSPHTVVTVQYNTTDGTAVKDTDYTTTNGTLTFGDNIMSRTIIVPIYGDGLYSDENKYFQLMLSNATNAIIDSPTTTINLVETDPVPIIELNATSFMVSEGSGLVAINVTRKNDAVNDVTINYSTANGTAYAGVNYGNTTGSLIFHRGEMEHIVTVPVYHDNLYSGPLAFTFSLSGIAIMGQLSPPPPPPTPPGPSNQTAVIVLMNIDAAPELWFDSDTYSVDENGGNVTITVMRQNDAVDPVAVTYNTSDGTALKGQDYVDTNGTLTFNRGEMSHTIQVPIIEDWAPGLNVTFDVTLSDPTGDATLGTPDRTMVTINESYRTFTYSLLKGWSMISVPFELNNDSVEAFFPASVRANLTDMWYYDKGVWVYYSGTRGYSPRYSHLINVTPGKGYWVKLSNNSSFTVGGTLNGTGVPAVGSGWTMFGVKGLSPTNVTVAYPGNKDLWYYTNGQWYYYSGTRGYSPKYPHLDSLDPGKGYWVHY